MKFLYIVLISVLSSAAFAQQQKNSDLDLAINWQPLEMLAYALLYTAVILTLWSMFIYLKAAWPYLKQP